MDMAIPQGFSIKPYLDELENLRGKLQDILQQHQLVSLEHRLLVQRVEELEAKVLPDNLSRPEAGKEMQDILISLLAEVGRPMPVREIGEILKNRNVIPIQILNVKTYVVRRLETACAAGLIQTYFHEEQNRKYYYLSEWTGGDEAGPELFYRKGGVL